MDRLSPENHLLITLIRTKLGEEGTSVVHSLTPKKLDWDYILRTAINQGIAPWLYYCLREFNGLVPVKVKMHLAKLAHATALNNMRLYQALKSVLVNFSRAGLPVMMLKGGLLTKEIYRNIALRPMCDIDLLIKKEDFKAANEILIRLGFRHEPHICPKERFEQFQGFHYYKADNLGIDLHWNFEDHYNFFSFQIGEIWQRSRKIKIAGIGVQALSPEDIMLHLCYHTMFAHTSHVGLRAFIDLAQTIRHYKDSINWGNLAAYAVNYKLSFIVYAGLFLTQGIMPRIIPEAALDKLAVNCTKSQISWLHKNRNMLFIPNKRTIIETHIWLRMLPQNKDRLRLIRLMLFPPISKTALYNSFPSKNITAYFKCLWEIYRNGFIKLITKAYSNLSGIR